MEVLTRRSGQDPFRLGIVAVHLCHPDSHWCLATSKFHFRIFGQNLAQGARVAGSEEDARCAPELDDWDCLTGSEDVVIYVDCFGEPALEYVSVREKIVSIRVPWIEREGGGEIAFGVSKMVAASINVALENKER